ncbi:Casein kinase II regulatory subunit family protein [Trichomonas vaginalis G3]|uniref:Casein kinase II subunit beta n=1 Tax=Trichomonas vaginalis (strain ATCC PRA-98 / G3) TaxID=412133 RepID=A2DDT8_TRIV3|nr:protein kinase regulator protein [Trichomonas vaginalis G3]EAY21464.1 Casein kinase II regulatory subunit family protein [Trichomonas vaginalis G3]KAI5490677.1 protein kinase regulator protein [Trichomonas vaginalis G3]|eukprot:XP_001582450.1 Casein kinase II regulatory subunit family protein [Trichomonas vaginalis G3]
MYVYEDFICETPNEDTVTTYSSEKQSVYNWVKKYCENNPWLISVNQAYINDGFNLYGLSEIINNYSAALNVIKDKPPKSGTENIDEINKDAIDLYHLIHQRFLLTIGSVQQMQEKYNACVYGQCPRVNCHHSRLLPIGISPKCNYSTVKLYCFSCNDVYDAPSNIKYDGAAFGPYFPQFFKQACTFNSNKTTNKNSELTYMGIPLESNDYMNRAAYIHGNLDQEVKN